MVRGVTKYAVMIDEPARRAYELEKAVYLATSGRPGPVWVDIPLDVQGASVDETQLRTLRAGTAATVGDAGRAGSNGNSLAQRIAASGDTRGQRGASGQGGSGARAAPWIARRARADDVESPGLDCGRPFAVLRAAWRDRSTGRQFCAADRRLDSHLGARLDLGRPGTTTRNFAARARKDGRRRRRGGDGEVRRGHRDADRR